jgi:hypothetical protein
MHRADFYRRIFTLPQKSKLMTPDLIPLTQFPTIPAPLHSSDAGESWVWGDFVLILQKNPITIAEVFNAMSPQKTFQPPPIEYPFAMSVFYRPNK